MLTTPAYRLIDLMIGSGLFALLVLNLVWVWPIATFRLF